MKPIFCVGKIIEKKKIKLPLNAWESGIAVDILEIYFQWCKM